MRNLPVIHVAIFLMIAVTSVKAGVITNASRIFGNTPGQPGIVTGPSPGGLQNGSLAFVDRGQQAGDMRNYRWENVPTQLVGADYIMTFNQDAKPNYSNAYRVTYSVTLNQSAMLYVLVDRRYVDNHGNPPFRWLTDGSSGNFFADTGLEILLDEVGGRNVLQPFNIYGAKVSAGTYTLGAACDGDSGRNFYAIAAVADAVIVEVERIGGVTYGQPEIVAGPGPGGLQEGSHAFVDRPLYAGDMRNYHWQGIPEELLGADYAKTYNDDKMPWDSYHDRPWSNDPYEISYSVTLEQDAMLYIFVDRRYVDSHGDPPFVWLTDGSSGTVFADTGLEILLDEVGGSNVLQPFNIYGAKVSAGTYVLGPACDGYSDRNFYAVAAVPKSDKEDFETGDFSGLNWNHGGDAPWQIVSGQAHSGVYSARAGNIVHNQESVLSLICECVAGDIGFFVRTSSESDYDMLIFTINGQQVDAWSGELEWTEASYGIMPGVYTFAWSYVKDGSGSVGEDTAWLDDIRFPLK